MFYQSAKVGEREITLYQLALNVIKKKADLTGVKTASGITIVEGTSESGAAERHLPIPKKPNTPKKSLIEPKVSYGGFWVYESRRR